MDLLVAFEGGQILLDDSAKTGEATAQAVEPTGHWLVTAWFRRRPYSYNNGVNFTAERWPPWRQGMEYDAGLLFLCYQRDPRRGFIKIFERMSKFDMMNQFVTHVGGGLFACPGGAREGEYIAQRLFERREASNPGRRGGGFGAPGPVGRCSIL